MSASEFAETIVATNPSKPLFATSGQGVSKTLASICFSLASIRFSLCRSGEQWPSPMKAMTASLPDDCRDSDEQFRYIFFLPLFVNFVEIFRFLADGFGALRVTLGLVGRGDGLRFGLNEKVRLVARA